MIESPTQEALRLLFGPMIQFCVTRESRARKDEALTSRELWGKARVHLQEALKLALLAANLDDPLRRDPEGG